MLLVACGFAADKYAAVTATGDGLGGDAGNRMSQANMFESTHVDPGDTVHLAAADSLNPYTQQWVYWSHQAGTAGNVITYINDGATSAVNYNELFMQNLSSTADTYIQFENITFTEDNQIREVKDVYFVDCDIIPGTDATSYGLQVLNCSFVTVIGCTANGPKQDISGHADMYFKKDTYGLNLRNSTDLTITACDLSEADMCIFTQTLMTDVTVIDCTFTSMGNMGSYWNRVLNDILIQDCTFTDMDHERSVHRLVGVSSGTFTVGETVTQAVSGAVGIVESDIPSTGIYLWETTATDFVTGQTVTGQTSLETVTSITLVDPSHTNYVYARSVGVGPTSNFIVDRNTFRQGDNTSIIQFEHDAVSTGMEITNNDIYDTSVGNCILIDGTEELRITNNTIDHPTSDCIRITDVLGYGRTQVIDMYNNIGTLLLIDNIDPGALTFNNNNNTFTGETDTGNFYTPGGNDNMSATISTGYFADYANQDYALTESSPARGAGDPVNKTTEDRDGYPRDNDDAGAYIYLDSATSFHVANGGDDTDAGTIGEPWANAPGMASWAGGAITLDPNDTLYFNRGDTWREQLEIVDSGTDGSPITFSAYGTGAKPLLLSSQARSSEDDWVDEGSNIWHSVGIAEIGDLATDGTFDDWGATYPDNWEHTTNADPGGADETAVTEVGPGEFSGGAGTGAVNLKNNSNNVAVSISQDMSLVTGVDYTVTFDFWDNGGAVLLADYAEANDYDDNVNGTGAKSVDFTATDEGLTFKRAAANTDCTIDNIRVTIRDDFYGSELISNNSFDTNDDDWITSNSDGANGVGTRTTTLAEIDTLDGGYKYTFGSDNGTGVTSIQISERSAKQITKGKLYRLTFRALATTELSLVVGFGKNSSPFNSYQDFRLGGTPTITTGWATYEVYMRANVTASDLRISFFIGDTLAESEVFYIDTVSFKELSGINLPATDVGNLIFDDEDSVGTKLEDEVDVDAQDEFWYDPTNLSVKIYSTSNPAIAHSVIELMYSEVSIEMDDTDWIVIDNIDFRYSQFVAAIQNTNNIIFQNLDCSYIGGGTTFEVRSVRLGNAIEVWESNTNCTVRYCTIDNVYDAGVTIQGTTAGKTTSGHSFYYNIISNCEYSFELWFRDGTSTISNCSFYNNTCIDAGGGFGHDQRYDSANGRHLMFWESSATPTNINIKNNIFYGATESCIRWAEDVDVSDYILNNNDYYMASGDLVVISDGETYTTAEFADYQSETSQDADSIDDDPSFVDEGSGDYTLLVGSPAINIGVDVGLTRDFNGDSINGDPDAGAFEVPTAAPPPSAPVPSDTGTSITLLQDLSWDGNGGEEVYDIYFGTDSSPDETELVRESHAATNWDPGALNVNTTYYWRVDSILGDTQTGEVWDFTTISSDIFHTGTGTEIVVPGLNKDWADIYTYDLATPDDLLTATPCTVDITLDTPVRPADWTVIDVDLTLSGTTAGAGDTIDITGTDVLGNAQVESIDVSGGDNTYTTAKFYATISDIDCTGWSDGVIAATQDRLGLIWNPCTGTYCTNADIQFGDGVTSSSFTSTNETVYFTDGKSFTITDNATLTVTEAMWHMNLTASVEPIGNGGTGVLNLTSSKLFLNTDDSARQVIFRDGVLTFAQSILSGDSYSELAFTGGTVAMTDTTLYNLGAWSLSNVDITTDNVVIESNGTGVTLSTGAVSDLILSTVKISNSVIRDIGTNNTTSDLILQNPANNISGVLINNAATEVIEQYTFDVTTVNGTDGVPLQDTTVTAIRSSIVVGSDTNYYKCISDIASAVDATHEPITGSSWQTYWILTDLTAGGDWVTGGAYVADEAVFSEVTDANGEIAAQLFDYIVWKTTAEDEYHYVYDITFAHAGYPTKETKNHVPSEFMRLVERLDRIDYPGWPWR